MELAILRHFGVLAGLLTMIAACQPTESNRRSQSKPPGTIYLTDPETIGIDTTLLDQAKSYAFKPERETQSVLILKGEQVIAEWYAEGKGKDSLVTTWSVAKSIMSALIGIAVERQEITSIDDSLATYLPGQPQEFEAITIRHMLEMTSGRQWQESSQAEIMATQSPDQLKYSQELGIAHEPGTVWSYSSADSMLLSSIFPEATGMELGDYAQKHLFQPLGINAEWWTDSKNQTLGYCCVDTTSWDLAKIGLIFAQNGQDEGRQIVPASWVEESTRPLDLYSAYGLHWWMNGSIEPSDEDPRDRHIPGLPTSMFYAVGFHGQFLYVFPDEDIIVVRNGTYQRLFEEAKANPGVGILTKPPASWDHASFLAPIFEAVAAAE